MRRYLPAEVAAATPPGEKTRAEAVAEAASNARTVCVDLPAPFSCPACGYAEGLP